MNPLKKVIVILLVLIAVKSYAQTKVCYTNMTVIADISFCFSKNPVIADLCVWIGGQASFTVKDIDVCFVSAPTTSSINVEIVNSPIAADVTIGITESPVLADKTLCITNSAVIADVSLGLYDTPTTFTKDIYVKGINPKQLTIEQKVSILYCLGLIKKER